MSKGYVPDTKDKSIMKPNPFDLLNHFKVPFSLKHNGVIDMFRLNVAVTGTRRKAAELLCRTEANIILVETGRAGV